MKNIGISQAQGMTGKRNVTAEDLKRVVVCAHIIDSPDGFLCFHTKKEYHQFLSNQEK